MVLGLSNAVLGLSVAAAATGVLAIVCGVVFLLLLCGPRRNDHPKDTTRYDDFEDDDDDSSAAMDRNRRRTRSDAASVLTSDSYFPHRPSTVLDAAGRSQDDESCHNYSYNEDSWSYAVTDEESVRDAEGMLEEVALEITKARKAAAEQHLYEV